ncbi:MAG: hypothetical protein JWO60_100 [Frankiales bacterium]|nr:hypothetical protein [Frankiales bacterium]
MTEQQHDDGDSRPQQGADARAAVDGAHQEGSAEVLSEGDRMARKLVQDVAAYEVDPPPPARTDPAS